MKTFAGLAGGLAIAAAGAVAASADTRSVAAHDFSRIDAANGVTVEIVYGEEEGVVVDGPAAQLDNVIVRVSDGALRLRPRRGGWFRGPNLKDVVVHVSARALDGLEVANGAVVTLSGAPGDADLSLEASNGGVIRADGECGRVDAQAARGGVIDAKDLDCRAAEADASMGGEISVRASESANAEGKMGGAVHVYGDAEDVSLSSSMGGAARRR